MLRNLGTILFQPRATMRRILDGGRDRMVVPLFLLSLLASTISDFDANEFGRVMQFKGPVVVLIVTAVLIVGTLVMLVLFYGASWAAAAIGRFLEGSGTARELRSAIAWALTPTILSMIYTIPVAILYRRGAPPGVHVGRGEWRFTPGTLQAGCGWALLIGLLDLALFVWTIWVMSNTIGEAHRFSTARGFGTLCLLLVIPVIIGLAAALAVFV